MFLKGPLRSSGVFGEDLCVPQVADSLFLRENCMFPQGPLQSSSAFGDGPLHPSNGRLEPTAGKLHVWGGTSAILKCSRGGPLHPPPRCGKTMCLFPHVLGGGPLRSSNGKAGTPLHNLCLPQIHRGVGLCIPQTSAFLTRLGRKTACWEGTSAFLKNERWTPILPKRNKLAHGWCRNMRVSGGTSASLHWQFSNVAPKAQNAHTRLHCLHS